MIGRPCRRVGFVKESVASQKNLGPGAGLGGCGDLEHRVFVSKPPFFRDTPALSPPIGASFRSIFALSGTDR